MLTQNLDLVYIVKNAEDNGELRYSLRSVAKNLPHRNVWIYGGRRDWLFRVKYGELEQVGKNKWEKTGSSLHSVVKNTELSDDFILMNDDFFVMRPIKDLVPYFYGTLEELLERRKAPEDPKYNTFEYRIKNALAFCVERGLRTNNYELHIPMIFNKEKLARLLEIKPSGAGTRSTYGNRYAIGGRHRYDCKIFGTKKRVDKTASFVSTEPDAFWAGQAGVDIRAHFPNVCKYEKPRL